MSDSASGSEEGKTKRRKKEKSKQRDEERTVSEDPGKTEKEDSNGDTHILKKWNWKNDQSS